MISKQDIINAVLDTEAGYVDNPDDSGGKTKYGITEEMARFYGYEGDMRAYLARLPLKSTRLSFGTRWALITYSCYRGL